MPREYTPKEREKALAKLAETGNLAKTARDLGIPENTLRRWRESCEKITGRKWEEVRDNKKKEIINTIYDGIKAPMLQIFKGLLSDKIPIRQKATIIGIFIDKAHVLESSIHGDDGQNSGLDAFVEEMKKMRGGG